MANLHVEPVCNCDEWGRDYFMRTMYPEGSFDVLLEPVIEHGLSVKCRAHTRAYMFNNMFCAASEQFSITGESLPYAYLLEFRHEIWIDLLTERVQANMKRRVQTRDDRDACRALALLVKNVSRCAIHVGLIQVRASNVELLSALAEIKQQLIAGEHSCAMPVMVARARRDAEPTVHADLCHDVLPVRLLSKIIKPDGPAVNAY